jgi:signal transduction histidine kinase
MNKSIKVLLIEDNPGDARLIREMLSEAKAARFDLDRTDSLSSALERLAAGGIDVVLLDLLLPDSEGLDTFTRVCSHASHMPIIVITGTDDEDLALQAVKDGAQDYLVKGHINSNVLGRAIIYAIERKRAEEALRESASNLTKYAEELEKKSEEVRAMSGQLWQTAKLATMGELAASIAHELNNPLQTVSLRVESLMAHVSPDDPTRSALEIIEKEVERMGNLVANLLQFSRFRPFQISTVDVREEIEKTLELIYYHLRKRNIKVSQEYSPQVPMIHADRQQLRQLFLNLFTNASDAMPQGGTLTIYVGLARPENAVEGEPPNKVIIEVSDTGVGIPPDDLPKVMEPFFTTKPEGKGTGLGLAICRRIVQEHHGRISIKSQVGEGTTVRVALPVTNMRNSAHLRET